ncbi:MAG: hypothetical protein E7167_00585 [Firmicutes bacterium]|nr:hypothetical protein [Bacillota bacterium]
MDIKEILGAEFGEAISFLVQNKKDIINGFYGINSSLTKPITGAFLQTEMKSALVFVTASILTAMSAGLEMPIADVILDIIRIGSGAVTGLTATGTLIIEILNYVRATKDYKSLLNMAKYFETHKDELVLPIMFASIVVTDEENVQEENTLR